MRLNRGWRQATLIALVVSAGAKVVISAVLCVLIATVLRPHMPSVAAYGHRLMAGNPDPAAVSHLFFPLAVSLAALSLTCALAVIRPGARGRAPMAPYPTTKGHRHVSP